MISIHWSIPFGIAAIVLASAALVMAGHNAHATTADTIVGINPGVEPYQLTVLPSNGVQPAYGVYVTQACRDTLHVGDSWPSADPACH